jgi:hypothetical protein
VTVVRIFEKKSHFWGKNGTLGYLNFFIFLAKKWHVSIFEFFSYFWGKNGTLGMSFLFAEKSRVAQIALKTWRLRHVCVCKNTSFICNLSANSDQSGPGLPDFSWDNLPKRKEIYQVTTKFTEWLQNLPNEQAIYQMTTNYTKRP